MTETNRRFSLDADTAYARVKTACIKLGLTIGKEDAVTRRIQVSTGWSAFSWGETMSILVTEQKEGSLVTIDSNPKVSFNFTASGRAKKNAKLLFDELETKSQNIVSVLARKIGDHGQDVTINLNLKALLRQKTGNICRSSNISSNPVEVWSGFEVDSCHQQAVANRGVEFLRVRLGTSRRYGSEPDLKKGR